MGGGLWVVGYGWWVVDADDADDADLLDWGNSDC